MIKKRDGEGKREREVKGRWREEGMKERGRGFVLKIFIVSDITKFKAITKNHFNLLLYNERKIFLSFCFSLSCSNHSLLSPFFLYTTWNFIE